MTYGLADAVFLCCGAITLLAIAGITALLLWLVVRATQRVRQRSLIGHIAHALFLVSIWAESFAFALLTAEETYKRRVQHGRKQMDGWLNPPGEVRA